MSRISSLIQAELIGVPLYLHNRAREAKNPQERPDSRTGDRDMESPFDVHLNAECLYRSEDSAMGWKIRKVIELSRNFMELIETA